MNFRRHASLFTMAFFGSFIAAHAIAATSPMRSYNCGNYAVSIDPQEGHMVVESQKWRLSGTALREDDKETGESYFFIPHGQFGHVLKFEKGFTHPQLRTQDGDPVACTPIPS